jgi:hypothetical protein
MILRSNSSRNFQESVLGLEASVVKKKEKAEAFSFSDYGFYAFN